MLIDYIFRKLCFVKKLALDFFAEGRNVKMHQNSFQVEDDWCSSPLNLGAPRMINTPDTPPQTSKPKQASSPLKLSQRQRQLQQQQNSSNDQVKVYVEPTVSSFHHLPEEEVTFNKCQGS